MIIENASVVLDSSIANSLPAVDNRNYRGIRRDYSVQPQWKRAACTDRYKMVCLRLLQPRAYLHDFAQTGTKPFMPM